MKKAIFLVAFVIWGSISAVSPQADEKAAVRVPLENYIKGHETGDGEYMKKAFHTEGNLIFVRDGKYMTRSFAEYINAFDGKPAADEAKRKRWIEMVRVSGNAAIAKVILDYPTTYFVDYFALLKIGGEWKIVNKSFHAQPSSEKDKVASVVGDADKKAVSVPLESYTKVAETFDGKYFLQAFRPEAKILSFSNGKFEQSSVEQYAALYTGEPDEDKPKTSFEIIDMYGNAAIAKVNLDFPAVRFTDYMTLLKIDGEWKIVNKTFSTEQKKASSKAKRSQ